MLTVDQHIKQVQSNSIINKFYMLTVDQHLKQVQSN